jgi:hypothetical protein
MAMDGPLIILALPRTYTTITSAMLGQHPQMYGLPEMNLFLVETMGEWWMRFGHTHAAGLSRAVAEVIFEGQTEATVRQAKQWLWQRRGWTTEDVLWELVDQIAPRVMVEKNPLEGKHRDIVESLERRSRIFPRAKFLHLVRHPRGFCKSYLELLEEMSKGMRPLAMEKLYARITDRTTNPPTLDPQTRWLRVNARILTFLESVAPEQQMMLRGEDLMADPDRYLREIALWMGLRADEDAIEEMKRPERSPFARLGPRNALLGGDPKFFKEPALRQGQGKPQSLKGKLAWREDGAGFSAEVKELARQLGYA